MAVAFFGDGAVNNGAFHEGLNLAGIWKLPVLFVCENNQFATEVPFAYAAGNPSVASRGASYGMPGVEVDGNDVLAVYRGGRRGRRTAPAAATGRRCSNAGPTAPGRTPRAWAISPTAPATRSKPGRPAARSLRFETAIVEGADRPRRRARSHRGRDRRGRRRRTPVRRDQPLARPRDRRRDSSSPSRRSPAIAAHRRQTPPTRRHRARSPSCRPRSRRSPRRWRATRRSS